MHKRRCDAKHNIENTLISVENTHVSVKSAKILNTVLINEGQRTKKCYSFNLVADKEISLVLFCYRDENVFR